MSSKVDVDLRMIQQLVYEDAISEDAWLAGQFLENAATNRNALIIPEDESTIKIFDVGDLFKNAEDIFKRLPRLEKGETLEFPMQLVLVADLDTVKGSKMAAEAVAFAKKHGSSEFLFVHSPSSAATLSVSVKLYQSAIENEYKLRMDELKDILSSSLDDFAKLPLETVNAAQTFWQHIQPLASKIGLQPGQQGILLNGRLVGPVPESLDFTLNEFEQLYEFEYMKRLAPANKVIISLGLEDRVATPLAAAVVSSLIALSTISDIPEGIFDSTSHLRMNTFDEWEGNHTMISTGNPETASIHFVASIDPTSELAQRWIPMLKVLSDLGGVHLKLFLNPRERMQELPIKRFYRHVLDSRPSFDNEGMLQDLRATFEGLPKDALLNLALDVPPAWLVAPKESIYDLDNIKLSTLKDGSNIDAIYELEHILIEGHSRDVTVGTPPRGAQVVLGTEKDPHFADTIIMANLGYFQFKANPGFWKLKLQAGRSQQIFNIDSAGQKGYSPQPGDESTNIALMSFEGKTLYPRLSRKPGRENDDVLEEIITPGSPMDYVSKASKFASDRKSVV